MQHYELLYLLTSKLVEEEVEPVNKQIVDLIEKHAGKITLEENLGKKRLAYPIKHNHNGYYQLLELDLPQEQLKEIENKIRLTNEVLRHQFIKKKVKTAAEMAREKKRLTRIEEQKEELEKVEEKAPLKDKLKLEDLDKKLDEILGGDDDII